MRHVEKIQLESDEHILAQVRKHWFVIAVQELGLLIVGILPIPLYQFLGASGFFGSLLANAHTGLLVTLYSAWLVGIWMGIFNIWTNYYLDVWTITNKRLIAVDQRGFFFRKTASFRLERLQDIEVTISGLIATLLNFGTLELQTAGVEQNFRATGLPRPGELKALILSVTDPLSTAEAPQKTVGV